MKKLLLTVILTAAFGFCFAPINRGIVPPDQIQRESTEAERARQQNNLPQMGHIGGADSGAGMSGGPIQNDPDAANAVANALNRGAAPKESSQARVDLVVANQNLKSGAEKAAPVFVWALILALVGFGLVYGARKWADKAIPEPAGLRKTVKW